MRVDVLVDSSLRLQQALPPEVDSELRELFTHKNPANYMASRRCRWQTKEPPFISTWRRAPDGNLVLPRGGTGRLRDTLRANGVEWCWVDQRQAGEHVEFGDHFPMGVGNVGALWDHQGRISDAVLERRNCLVRSSTGSGKTTALIATIARAAVPALVMVYDSALLKQWQRRLARELGMTDVGVIGGGSKRFRPVTLAMQQTLRKLDDEDWHRINSYFGTFVVDEVQRAAAYTFIEVIDRVAARTRVGISADETRKDKKEFLTYDLFGEVVLEVSHEELVDKGIVLDVAVRVVPTDFEAPWYQAVRGDPTKVGTWKRLLDQMCADEARNNLACSVAFEQMAAGHQTVMFSWRREHCMELNRRAAESGWRSGLMLGSDENALEFEQTIAQLDSRYLSLASGTYNAIGQGLDIPTVSRGVAVGPMFNRQLFNQVRGRLCRTAVDKRDAVLYYLWDRSLYGVATVKNLAKWARDVRVLSGGVYIEAQEFLRGQREEVDREEEQERRSPSIFKQASQVRARGR